MATIRKNTSGTWQVRWRDPNGKQTSQTFARKTEALKKRAQVETQLQNGQYIDANWGKARISELATAWLSDPSWSIATIERNQSILDNYVLPQWGSTPINGLRHSDIQTWVNQLAKQPPMNRVRGTLSPYTVRKIVGALRGIIKLAIRDHRIRQDPSEGLRLPRQVAAKRKYLNPIQVEQLAVAANDDYDAILLLAYTGLRFGEFAALRVGDVDIADRRIEVQRSVSHGKGGARVGPTKSGSWRRVLLPEFLVPLIRARIAGRPEAALVFPDANGNHRRNRNFRRDVFDPAAKAVGLDGLVPHSLRHTAASIMISANWNVLAVQRMLGHAKPSTTLDHYADLFENDLDDLGKGLIEARQAALENDVTKVRDKALVDEMWMAAPFE